MFSMENPPNLRRSSHNLVQVEVAKGQVATIQGQANHRRSRPSGKFNKRPLLPDTCYRCGKGRPPKGTGLQGCGCYMQRVWKERTLWEGLPEGKMLCTLWRPHRPILQGAGEPLYFNDEGHQCTLIWSVSPMQMLSKHLIKFPVALETYNLKGNNVDSSQSTVLLKADTGADINLMNRKTFNQLFGEAKEVLKLTPIKMENYGNTAVKVLGMFHAFLRWEDKVYRQLFYVTDCDRLWQMPQLAVKGCLLHSRSLETMLHLWRLLQRILSPTVNASKNGDVVAKSFHHQKMNGSEEKLSNNSNEWSINQSQLQGTPLTKQDIPWHVLWCFYWDREFPGMPYKFQLKENAKPPDMHLGKFLYTCKTPSTRKSGI